MTRATRALSDLSAVRHNLSVSQNRAPNLRTIGYE